MIELILHLRCQWAIILIDHRNVRHTLRVQLLLHFGYRQSLVVSNAELLQTGFQSAAADRVHNQRKLWRVRLPVCRSFFPIRTSSELEIEELGVVVLVDPEVETKSAVDATETEHNSLCVVRRPDNGLQVFRAEVDAVKVNFFRCPRCCPQKRVSVELRLYSCVIVWRIIDCEQFESCWSAVAEEAGEVYVCIWNLFDSNSAEIGQPESGSHAVSHQRFLLFVVETDLEIEAGDVRDLKIIKFELIKIMKLYLLYFLSIYLNEYIKLIN